MKETLKRICELQPYYSAENTSAMQERGLLVRRSLKQQLEALEPVFAPMMGSFSTDFLVEASDGIGRKTELPWVRFCSRNMSPSPTEGFYGVVHFSTDGSAVHITIGCGSSRFLNGSSVPLPDHELDAQTAWARRILREAGWPSQPFVDAADFGAKRALPISFQRATAISRRVEYSEIDTTNFVDLFSLAAARLRAIYEAQATGRDLSEADQRQLEIAATLRPLAKKTARQGYGLPPLARIAVEQHAMDMAEAFLISAGYEVDDTSANSPFDFEACLQNKPIKIEVKGTTSDRPGSILMTANEVELHRREKGETGLIIVSNIRLTKSNGIYSCSGGDLEWLLGWDIDEWLQEPTAFRVTRA
jgi:hypothetical protein